MIANAATAFHRPGADMALLTTSHLLWARSGWSCSSLPSTRRCFVRVTYWGERDFQKMAKLPSSQVTPLCQISFTSFPRMAAHTVYSQQCLSQHQEPPPWGSAKLGSVLQIATKKSPAEAVLKFGSPCGSVKEAARPGKCELCSIMWRHGLSTVLKEQELLYTPGHQQQEIRAALKQTSHSTGPDPPTLLCD